MSETRCLQTSVFLQRKDKDESCADKPVPFVLGCNFSNTVSIFFGRKMMKQLEEKFWLCILKASTVGTRKTLVSGRTPRHWRSIVSQCPHHSRGPGPVRGAQHAAFLLPQPMCPAVPQSKNKTHSHPDILSSHSFPLRDSLSKLGQI